MTVSSSGCFFFRPPPPFPLSLSVCVRVCVCAWVFRLTAMVKPFGACT